MAREFLSQPMGPSWKGTHDLIQQSLGEVSSSVSVAVYRKSEPELFRYAYEGQVSGGGASTSLETQYDLASLTKVLVTAPLVALFVERGWIRWNTPLREFFPVSPLLTVENLMAHHSGLPNWLPFFEEMRKSFPHLERHSLEEKQRHMRSLVFEVEPGTPKTLYSDLGMLLLGFMIEEVTGQRLDKAAQKYLWSPLGIKELGYRYIGKVRGPTWNIAATEDCPWRGKVLQGEVHDDNCYSMGGVAGHAGVFGTLKGVMQFVAGLQGGGILSSPSLKEYLYRRPFGDRGLGWDVRSPDGSLVGTCLGSKVVGHWGFTGTGLWMDPETGVALLQLTNRVHPLRGSTESINHLRPRLNDQLWKDLQHQPQGGAS